MEEFMCLTCCGVWQPDEFEGQDSKESSGSESEEDGLVRNCNIAAILLVTMVLCIIDQLLNIEAKSEKLDKKKEKEL